MNLKEWKKDYEKKEDEKKKQKQRLNMRGISIYKPDSCNPIHSNQLNA